MRWRQIIGGVLAGICLLDYCLRCRCIFFPQKRELPEDRHPHRRKRYRRGNRWPGGDWEIRVSAFLFNCDSLQHHPSRQRTCQPAALAAHRQADRWTANSIYRPAQDFPEPTFDRASCRICASRRNGKSNLPQSPRKQDGRNITVFDLAARHVRLTDGQVHYNDRAIPLEADLCGLKIEIHFVPIQVRYDGSISYDSGTLRYGSDPVVAHSLDARFSATPSAFSLESALLKVGSSTLSLNAELNNYANPTIEGRYDLRIHGQDFSRISKPVMPAGDVSLSGTVRFGGENNENLLRRISLEGGMTSDQIAASSPDGRLNLRRLQGRYQLRNGTLQAQDIVFETLGGTVSADIEIRHLETMIAGQLRITLRGISLRAAQRALRTVRSEASKRGQQC